MYQTALKALRYIGAELDADDEPMRLIGTDTGLRLIPDGIDMALNDASDTEPEFESFGSYLAYLHRRDGAKAVQDGLAEIAESGRFPREYLE
jgi:hypothetical protein